eukprot:XP_011453911.1 PREDICTED: uncharacterized protein LOC105346862 [Crassostrea gigas]
MMWITFLFAFILQASCMACPDDYVIREQKGVTTCCKATNCHPGEGFYLCNGSIAAPGEDKCYKCPVGTYNKDPVNTAEVPDGFSDNVCASIDCSCHHDGTIIWNLDSCLKGSDKVCVCDREKLFFGFDPNTCQKIDDVNTKSRISRPGFELDNNGKIKRCQRGFFKSKADLSICEPHTQCPVEAGLQVKVEGTATSDAVCENATAVPTSGESTSPLPVDKDKNVTHPIEPVVVYTLEFPVGAQGTLLYVCIPIAFLLIVCIICLLVRRYSLAEKLRRIIGKVTQQREAINDLSSLEDDDPNIPLRGNPIPDREPDIFSEVDESEANQRSQSITDFVDLSSLPSTINMQSDQDSRTSGSEDIDFSEQNEQTSLKAIQNSSFENSSSNIGRNRPVASVLPSVRQSSQEERETGQVIASPVQEDGVRVVALGVNTIPIPFNYRAQSDSGIADDEESPTGSNVTERYHYEH